MSESGSLQTSSPAGLPSPVQAIMPGPLGLIGRALQARLQAAFPLEQFEHNVVPAKVDVKDWRMLTRRTPFVGLGWNDLMPDHDGGGPFVGASNWSVFLATVNQGSIGARYFGDAAGQQWAPGLFAMIQVGVAVLHGLTLPRLGSVRVSRASNVFVEGWDENMAAAVIDISVRTTIALGETVTPPADLGRFEEMQVWQAPER
ncbi:MAG: hypothetical protein ACYCZB_18130 [Acidiphilium sp.]